MRPVVSLLSWKGRNELEERLVGRGHRESLGTEGVALPFGDHARVEAAAGDDADQFIGLEIPARSKTMRVLERKRAERVDSSIDDPEVDPMSARRLGMRTGLYVPLLLRDEAIGVITAIGGAPGLTSSAVIRRPNNGATPRNSIMFGVTTAPLNSCVSPLAV